MKRSGGHTKNKTARGALIFGIILNTVLFFICTLIASAILNTSGDPTGGIGIASMISFYVCAALCGFTVSKYKGEGGILPAVMSALLFSLVLLAVGLIATGGALPFVSVVNYIVYTVIAALFAFLGRKRNARRHRR